MVRRGGNRKPDWNASAVITEVEDGITYFWVVDFESILPEYAYQGVKTKNPGGGMKPGELNPVITVFREVEEEFGLTPVDGLLELILNPPPGDFRLLGIIRDAWHKKYFYHIQRHELVGTMRTEKITDNDSILYPPRRVQESDINDRYVRVHADMIRVAAARMRSNRYGK